MPTDYEKQKMVRALIPDGPSQQQVLFRALTALACADGIAIADAIEFATEEARKDDPNFQPVYDVALLLID
jgi:hypothetical protein